RHHVVRGARVRALDLAPRLLDELVREARVRVRGPLDQVQVPLALADLRRQRAGRAPGACPRRGDAQRYGDRGGEHVPPANPPHPCPPPVPISNMCSGRHSRRTRLPLDSSASREDDSRFCLTTVSSPPESSSTVYRVNMPTSTTSRTCPR